MTSNHLEFSKLTYLVVVWFYLNQPAEYNTVLNLLTTIYFPWTDILILALQRDGELITPNGNTELQIGDRLSLLGRVSCLEKAEDYFQ